MPIDLKQFCAKNDPREYLCSPWREDGKVIASDGRIMVIVDDMPGMPGDFPGPDSRVAGRWRQLVSRVSVHFTDTADRVWHRLADLRVPPNKPCPSCGGAGYRWSRSYPDCGGDGYFSDGSDEHDCWGCDGTGVVFVDTQEDGDKTCCGACAGTGIRFDVFKVGGMKFQVGYLNLLKALPECEMTVSATVNGDMASFRFAGGIGYLMALRSVRHDF